MTCSRCGEPARVVYRGVALCSACKPLVQAESWAADRQRYAERRPDFSAEGRLAVEGEAARDAGLDAEVAELQREGGLPTTAGVSDAVLLDLMRPQRGAGWLQRGETKDAEQTAEA